MADNETGIKYDSEKEAVYSNFFALMDKNTESYRRRVLRAEGFKMAATFPATNKLEIEDIEQSFKEVKRKRKQGKDIHPHTRPIKQTYEIHRLTNLMGSMYKEGATPEETGLEASEDKMGWKYPAASVDISGKFDRVYLNGLILRGVANIDKPEDGRLLLEGGSMRNVEYVIEPEGGEIEISRRSYEKPLIFKSVSIFLTTKSGANAVIFEDGKTVEV